VTTFGLKGKSHLWWIVFGIRRNIIRHDFVLQNTD